MAHPVRGRLRRRHTRERLFMVARCDGKPIVWPEPTHHKKPAHGQKRWVPAADCIDWSIPCPSIFERAKPLADATLRRIARGIQRFVLDSADPFIVPITHHGSDRVNDIDDPLRTITTAHRGEFALCAPTLVGVGGRAGQTEPTPGGSPMNTITAKGDTAIAAATLVQMGYGEREGQAPRSLDITDPMGTIVGTGKHAAVCAYLMQANGGFNETPGHDLRRPASTITNSGSQQQMVSAVLVTNTTNHAARDMGDPAPTITTGGHHAAITAHLTTLRKNCVGVPADNPVPTITAGAEHHAAVTCTLSPEHEAGALRVAAFLTTYYGNGQECDPRDPMNTVTTRDRLALVTVVLKGTPYLIVDIGLRMLTPRELYRAQGFPPDYQIEVGHDGRRFPKSAQVRMVGNSVSPPPAAALIAANCGDLRIEPIRRRA
jgi:DNA (cytosine-5)-methyltransferase 1